MNVRVPIALAIVLACAPAYAQHDHGGHEHHDVAEPFAATVSLVAASFDTMLYLGNYQGVLPSARWGNSWFSAAISGAAYRIERNGATYYGPGDIGVHTAARLVHTSAHSSSIDAGVAFAATGPTGAGQAGPGMGHLMLMPAVFGGWSMSRVHLGGSIGYSRALGGGGSHADHGSGPLVSPMLPSEISWSAGADVRVVSRVTAGARGSGGIPVGSGNARVVVGGRVAWQASRVESAFELQAGVAGDPFTVRGVVSTALSF